MNVVIHPKKLSGSLVVPPSKSLSHRAIIAASLAEGTSTISNVLLSEDILATIHAMEALGAAIEIQKDTLIIKGCRPYRAKPVMNANESGSTLRFLIPIALTDPKKMMFEGKNHLIHRPLDTYFELFEQYGISFEHPKDAYLPLHTCGGFKPGVYRLRGDISSQFITGLFFALPLLKGDSTIEITTKLESKGYIDLTLDILKKFGIQIDSVSENTYFIKGNQAYQPCSYRVEGDYSQVAFFLVAGALGADIKLLGMNPNSYQGDKKIIADIQAMGGKISFDEQSLCCVPSDTKGATIDFSQSPDLGPALTVLASLSHGTSRWINASRLRIKECDRITAMKEELEKMGGRIIEYPDGMQIDGVDYLCGATVDSHNDHRIAMALAMASLKTKGDIRILNAGAVSKSYPHFWDDFISLGGELDYE